MPPLSILCFSLSFSKQNPWLLPLVSLKSSLNWPKIWNSLLLQYNQINRWWTFVTGIKIFTPNKLLISIVLIWYLPIVNLLSFLPVLMHCCIQDFFFLEMIHVLLLLFIWYCYMSDATEYVFRRSEIKTHIFLNLRQPWCQYRKNTISKNGFSKKSLHTALIYIPSRVQLTV